MNKTTLEIDEDGNVRCLYTDIIDLYSIGEIVKVRKASNVEFNEAKQSWEVLSLSGEVLYTHTNRETAIEWEIEHFSPGGDRYDGESDS